MSAVLTTRLPSSRPWLPLNQFTPWLHGPRRRPTSARTTRASQPCTWSRARTPSPLPPSCKPSMSCQPWMRRRRPSQQQVKPAHWSRPQRPALALWQWVGGRGWLAGHYSHRPVQQHTHCPGPSRLWCLEVARVQAQGHTWSRGLIAMAAVVRPPLTAHASGLGGGGRWWRGASLACRTSECWRHPWK